MLSALLLASLPLRGSCIGPMSFVVEVEVSTCTPTETFVSEGTYCMPSWAKELHRRMMERNRGVVVEGIITQQTEVSWYDGKSATFGSTAQGDDEGRWFLKSDSVTSCEAIKPGAHMQLLLIRRCCDVIPPHDLSCWYGLDTLTQVPEPILMSLQGR